jgi:sugar lactone lactonase YvrE
MKTGNCHFSPLNPPVGDFTNPDYSGTFSEGTRNCGARLFRRRYLSGRVYLNIFLGLSCAVIFFSCAAKPGQEGVSKPTALPQTTGAVRLVFEGTFGEAGMLTLGGISFGPDGSLYVCDTAHRALIRLGASGEVLARFGRTDSRKDRMLSPTDVAAGSGIDIFVLDGVNSRVFRLDRNLRDASPLTSGGAGNPSRFGTFAGIALDSESGDIYLTETSDGTVVRLDLAGNIVQDSGSFGSGKRSLRDPEGIDAAPGGVLYIADRGLYAVAVTARFGADIRLLGKGALEAPVDVAALHGGRIAVADARGILILSGAGVPEGFAGYGSDREMSPHSIAYHEGKLFVADARSRSILVYRVETGGNR